MGAAIPNALRCRPGAASVRRLRSVLWRQFEHAEKIEDAGGKLETPFRTGYAAEAEGIKQIV